MAPDERRFNQCKKNFLWSVASNFSKNAVEGFIKASFVLSKRAWDGARRAETATGLRRWLARVWRCAYGYPYWLLFILHSKMSETSSYCSNALRGWPPGMHCLPASIWSYLELLIDRVWPIDDTSYGTVFLFCLTRATHWNKTDIKQIFVSFLFHF